MNPGLAIDEAWEKPHGTSIDERPTELVVQCRKKAGRTISWHATMTAMKPAAALPDLPFSELGPDEVLHAIESLGVHCDGRLLALNSYENRVYQIGVEDQPPWIAKFYRPGRWSDAQILEEHAFAADLEAAEVPIIAPIRIGDQTLHHCAGHRVALYPRRGGRAPELADLQTLQTLGLALGRLHACGSAQLFRHRDTLDILAQAQAAMQTLCASTLCPRPIAERLMRLAPDLLQALSDTVNRAGEHAQLRLHGDCHIGNILWREERLHFVDLDDSLNGPAIADLWMLLSGETGEQIEQLCAVLDGYRTFQPFSWRQTTLIEPLRTLRLLHMQAWIARRWSDPAFPPAFPWFDSPANFEGLLGQLQEQMMRLQEPSPWDEGEPWR